MRQDGLFSDSRTIQTNPNDVVYTPDAIAQSVVSYFKPTGFCLDPCRGTGAFYRWLPTGSDWCEIAEGRDFFAFDRKVDRSRAHQRDSFRPARASLVSAIPPPLRVLP